MGRVSGSRSSTTKPSSTKPAPAKSTGFFSSIGNALHKVAFGDEKPGGGLWGEVVEAGKMLSYPVKHPIKFLGGLGDEVNEAIYKPILGLTGKHKLPLVGNVPSQWDPKFQRAQFTTEGLTNAPGLRMLPFWTVTGDIAQGKMPKLSHVLLDVASIIGPAKGRGTKVLGDLGAASEKAGVILSKLPKGEKLVGKVNSGTAWARELLPTSRSGALKAFPESVRRSEMTVARNLADVEAAFRRSGLDDAGQLAFRKAYLDRGLRPKDPTLGALYDSVKKWEIDDAAFKLSRELPAEQTGMLKYEIEADFRDRLSRTRLGPERAESMFAAWHKGDANPFPEFPKEWRGLQRELTKRLVNRTRTARLFKFNPELPGIPEQVYPFVQYKTLRSAKFAYKAGKITPETYRDIVGSMTPGKYEALMQMTKSTQDFARFRQQWESGFGAASYRTAVKEANQTWLDLAEMGVNPVYVPRKSMPTATAPAPKPGPYLQTAKPGELKATTGRGEHYFEGPLVMIRDNAFQLTNQTVTQKAIAQVVKQTGGASYEATLRGRMRNYSPVAAEQWIRDNFRSINPEGRVGPPVPGSVIVRRDVAKGVELYLQRSMPKMIDKMFHAWTVPVMHLAPMFHANNIVGGVALTSLKSHLGPVALLEYGKEALRMVRTGSLDPGVPRGVGMAPEFAGMFTKESRIAAGRGLWEALRNNVRHPIEFSKRFNNFMDTFYKSVQWLDEMDDTLKKGGDYATARANANYAASNLMQNWDSFSPFERLVVQRVFPFWGWKKAMIKTVLTYPMDHPFRMHFMAQLSRDEEERTNLPEEWEQLLAITGEGEDGKKYYLSLRGIDMFADVADFFSLQGFVQNAHPFLRAAIEATGFDPYIGGVPLFTRKGNADIDRRTGQTRRSMGPDVKDAISGLIPQIQAITTGVAALLEAGVPPPDENTEAAWVKWFDRYGSQLRLIPGLSRRSEKEAAEFYQENLKTVEGFNRPREEAPTRARTSGGGRSGGGRVS